MHIALIDDDPAQAATLRTHLEKELIGVGDVAHRITDFPSGEDFLATFEKEKFDLILLDIYMGGMNGAEAAYEIRKRDADVLLVFCTSSNEFASESFEVGARYYLRKPVTAEGIATMLHRLNLDDVEMNRAVTLPDGRPVRACFSQGALLITVENVYRGKLRHTGDGDYLSTKNEKRGTGIASVRALVKASGGKMEVTHTDTHFTVTVFLTA